MSEQERKDKMLRCRQKTLEFIDRSYTSWSVFCLPIMSFVEMADNPRTKEGNT